MKALIAGLLVLAPFAAAQGNKQKFTGIITDSACADGDHSHMKMGPTNAECVKMCILYHDSSYVLFDGKESYTLSDQKTPEKFAGQKVTVTGILNAKTKTIQVESIQ